GPISCHGPPAAVAVPGSGTERVAAAMNDGAAGGKRGGGKGFPGGGRGGGGGDLGDPPRGGGGPLGPRGRRQTAPPRAHHRREEATDGQVLVRGRDVRGQPAQALRRSIGYVIQEAGLFPHLNVAANVATVPRLLGWARARVRRRVAEVLELVGLPEARFGRRL